MKVTGATGGLTYAFTWTVTDPSGGSSSDATSQVAPSSTFTVSVVYPTDFVGASLNYVGRYSVTIFQTSPSPMIATNGYFEVGLTDLVNYQRTQAVSIRASGYNSNDTITVNVSLGGNPAPGFPNQTIADGNGNVAYLWSTSASIAIGNYTVTLSGLNTPAKPVPDRQSFNLGPAVLTISQLSSSPSQIERTQSDSVSFSANYPDGSSVQTGSARVTITEPDQTLHAITAYYNFSVGLFWAIYRVSPTSQVGIWNANVTVNAVDDGYGNTGPDTSLSTSFNVQPASLTVNVALGGGTHTVGDILIVSASVTNPDGTSFSQGRVTAQFSLSGQPVGTLVTLQYDASQSKWVGSYTVRNVDPSGLWVLEVDASDSYGNSGESSSSTLVSVQAAQSDITSLWFLWIIGAVAAGLAGFIVLRKRKVTRHRLQIDLQAVSREASRVTSQDFFKTVQEQLGRKKEPSREDS